MAQPETSALPERKNDPEKALKEIKTADSSMVEETAPKTLNLHDDGKHKSSDGANPGSDQKLQKDAIKQIREETHCLFCSICKSNITDDAMLVEKNSNSPYNRRSIDYVSWVLRLNLPRFYLNSSEQKQIYHTEHTLSLPTLSPPWLLLALVVLLLSVTVMGFPLVPSIKIDWLIHVQSINYFSIFSLLFLAILALLWTYGPPSISYLIGRGNAQFSLTPAHTDEDPDNPPAHTDEDPDKPPVSGPTKNWKLSLPKFLKNLKVPTEDILKSIVYGGLVESITSLGVVSSAAASGASTLNVLALGLANLFSGLFLIIHKLYELKKYATDEYKKKLGEEANYKLHYVVVVISFIFFGVIPPLFYGLSFKQTDKGHYKAAVVLAASLVCVISLSFTKANIFTKDRIIRTMAEYTGMAIGASALSFIASQLVSDMLEKSGFHELASDYRKA